MTSKAKTAAEAALRTQEQLDRAMDHYSSLDEIELARSNVLEVTRLNPQASALCQMMLASLRSRQRALEQAGVLA